MRLAAVADEHFSHSGHNHIACCLFRLSLLWIAMLKSDITPRTDYGFREKRVSGAPLEHVRVVQHIRGNKWKTEWIDPNPGLVHYAESGQLVCIWKERKAFLQEEESRARILERNEEQGYSDNSPIAHALYEVFESVGESGVSFYKGVLRCSPEAIDRVRTRAKMNTGQRSPYAYTDRQGTLHLPFEEALDLAQHFCAAEPATVLAGVETTEREWAREARTPGYEYKVSLLNEFRASWALIRQWTGHDPAIAQREAEIQMLERLVWDAIYALQKAGVDSEAARLRRAIERKR